MPVYFDPTCLAGDALPITESCLQGCHCSVNVSLNCDESLEMFTGADVMYIEFERVKWNEGVAAAQEALNQYQPNPQANGADLVGYGPGFNHSVVVYRYYGNDSCEMQECLTSPGFKKLVLFDSIHINVGTVDLDIGMLNYSALDAATFDSPYWHYMYYWAECHRHPHFSEYAQYQIGSSMGHKQGFCIQTTQRMINARTTPTWAPEQTCWDQGVEVGWADSYNLGISCQWVDITSQDTSHGAINENLTCQGNPDHWLCEGNPQFYANGSHKWNNTGVFTTSPPYQPEDNDKEIQVYSCATSPGAWNNNLDVVPFTNPLPGQGALTGPCSWLAPPQQLYGPNRDCEFVQQTMMNRCQPGHSTTLSCSIPSGAKPQVLRLCESSIALQTGTACRIMDQASFGLFNSTLYNGVILPGSTTTVRFTCPEWRDPVEVGGYYSIYSGAVYNGVDQNVAVTCH